jgi:hypothetical protein
VINSPKTEHFGVYRPEPKHDRHELKIFIKTKDKASDWNVTLDLETKKNSPPKFIILDLFGKVRPSTGEMRQTSNTQSEFTVELAGDASLATLYDLSHMNLKDWTRRIYSKLGERHAAILIVVMSGRISVTFHSGEQQP